MCYVTVSFCSMSVGLISDTYCNPFTTLSHRYSCGLNNPIDTTTDSTPMCELHILRVSHVIILD